MIRSSHGLAGQGGGADVGHGEGEDAGGEFQLNRNTRKKLCDHGISVVPFKWLLKSDKIQSDARH